MGKCTLLLIACLGLSPQTAPAEEAATSAVRQDARSPWHLESSPLAEAAGGAIRDLELFDLGSLSQIGRTGEHPTGVIGMSFFTTSCNVGTVNLDWFAPMFPNHPLIIQNLYRKQNDRLEQIGLAWVKHGFASTNSTSTGCGTCQDPNTSARLGPGCSDTYGVTNNGDRTWLGPRDEVNPFTGIWACAGSYFADGEADCVRRNPNANSNLGPTDHRIEVQESDLGVPGASYYIEGYYIIPSDDNVYNNVGYREVTTSWEFIRWESESVSPKIDGPVVLSWGDEHATFTAGEGDVIIAAKATQLSVGNFHYEYALYNHNLDRQLYSLSIPIDPTAVVTNVGFRDVDQDAGNDWSATVAGGMIRFETDDYVTDPLANSLKYATLYNFYFDADKVPVESLLTTALFKPGTGASLTAQVLGPQTGTLDCNTNGIDDIQDIINGTSEDCNSNGKPDECDVSELRSPDCNGDQVPDECQLTDDDCNTNQIPDECDVSAGTSADCQPNGTPDECELGDNDCNSTGTPDECDLALGTSQDCQPNGLPDDCDVYIAPFAETLEVVVDPPLDIPLDNGEFGATHTFFVPNHGTIADLDVGLVITHTFNGDLEVTLMHDGVSVSLIDRPGKPPNNFGFNDDGFDVILDDSAPIALESFDQDLPGVPISGIFSPIEPLSAFNGMDKYGQWHLNVKDHYAPADSGTLDAWSLHIDDAGRPGEGDCNRNLVPDICEPDSDGDRVIDDCVIECACGDYNLDGVVDLNDFILLVACYDLGTPSASCPIELLLCVDMNRDGGVDLNDFIEFVQAFAQPPSGSPPDCGQ